MKSLILLYESEDDDEMLSNLTQLEESGAYI